MGTIVGTDGDDILRGDGQSPIFGGKGNDTVFLTGAEKEANFDPGNDTFKTSGKSEWGAVGFNLAVADSFNFSLKNPILNFTTKPITTSGKVISPNTGLDPWGGIDTFELGADITRLDLYPGQLDDSIYIDNRYRPFFWYEANQPNGNDLIISSNYPTINIGGSSEKPAIIIIGGSSEKAFVNLPNGRIEIRPETTWATDFSLSLSITLNSIVQGSSQKELFSNWGTDSTFAGGPGVDSFYLQRSGGTTTITDYSVDDALVLSWVYFDWRREVNAKYTAEDISKFISVSQQSASNPETTLTVNIPDTKSTTIKLNGLFALDSVQKTGNGNSTSFFLKLKQDPFIGSSASDLIVLALDSNFAFSLGGDTYKVIGDTNGGYFRFNNAVTPISGITANFSPNSLTSYPNSKTEIQPFSLINSLGGIDYFDLTALTEKDGYGVSIDSTPFNDFILVEKASARSKFQLVLSPGFGNDIFHSDGSANLSKLCFNAFPSNTKIEINLPEKNVEGLIAFGNDSVRFKNINKLDFQGSSGNFLVQGSSQRDSFDLNGANVNVTVSGGTGGDWFALKPGNNSLTIRDYSREDYIDLQGYFQSSAVTDKSISDLESNSKGVVDVANFVTRFTFAGVSNTGSSVLELPGVFQTSITLVRNESSVVFSPSLLTSSAVSSFPGNALTSSGGKVGPWLVHDMAKPLSLTPYQDLIGFDASKVTSATKVTGFKSGADLLQLSASTAPAGAAISMNLESKQFVAGPGVKQPTAPDQYVLYDTNTGTVYFDQDGNGPSPTWAAMILEAGTALASSDIQISKPQVFRLEADRSLVDESGTLSVLIGSSNVAPNTEVSYSISGISSFDLSGVKLTGSVKLDGNGEALLKLPIAADGITEGTETLTLTLAGQTLSVPINDSSRAASADTVPPTLSAFAPADGAVGVAVNSNLAITFSEPITRGTGSITLKTAAGATVESFGPTSNRITVSGSTLTIDPTKSLDIYSRYVLDLGAGAVQDQAGNASVASNQYDFRTETPDGLYHFFVVAFGAAPGVTYMGQLAEAFNYGLSLLQIVEIFTTKSQFTAVYPETLSNKELATKLVANIIKNSANEIAKQSAVEDIEAAFGIGWTRGRVIYQVFNNLANKPLTDVDWGGTAKQFQNQLAVARYFTETLEGDTTNVGRLQAVLGNVTKDSDVSSTAKLSQLLAQPSFVVSADKASVNEGSVAMFSISSYGLAAGSSVSYALSGTNLTGADVVGGSLAGSVTLDSSGSGFISVQFADDKTTEGNENLNLLLQGNVVKTITVLDTSTLPIATDTIAPTLIGSNYLSGSKDVPINANFFFTFSETIKKGNGTVQLLGANGALIEAFNVQTSSRLTWSGTQLTLDPSIDLANGETYRLVIPPGAIDDQAGNGFAGVSVEIKTVGDATPPPPPPGF